MSQQTDSSGPSSTGADEDAGPVLKRARLEEAASAASNSTTVPNDTTLLALLDKSRESEEFVEPGAGFQRHVVVRANPGPGEQQLRPGRVIILGDTHGCRNELKTLLAKQELDYDPKKDNLIIVGDLVNKGDYSCELVKYLMEDTKALAVRGNHDVMALYYRAKYDADQKYFENNKGGKAEQFSWTAHLHKKQVEYLTALPFSISLPDYAVLIVHGGLVPGVALEDQLPRDFWTMRNVYKYQDKQLFAYPSPETGATITPTYKAIEKFKIKDQGIIGDPWSRVWSCVGQQHVFFGHDAGRYLQSYPAATGIDTGCVYGGYLTAAVLPEMHTLLGSAAWLHRKAGAPTFTELCAKLHSVRSGRQYSDSYEKHKKKWGIEDGQPCINKAASGAYLLDQGKHRVDLP